MITYDAWTWIWRLNLQLVAFRLSTLSYYVLQGWEFTNTTTSFRNQFRCYLSYRLKVDIVHSITMGLHFWLHAQATKVFKLSNKFLIPKCSASKWTACGSPTISSLQYSELQPPFKGCRHLLLSCGCFQAVLKSRASVFFLLTYCLHLKEFLLFFLKVQFTESRGVLGAHYTAAWDFLWSYPFGLNLLHSAWTAFKRASTECCTQVTSAGHNLVQSGWGGSRESRARRSPAPLHCAWELCRNCAYYIFPVFVPQYLVCLCFSLIVWDCESVFLFYYTRCINGHFSTPFFSPYTLSTSALGTLWFSLKAKKKRSLCDVDAMVVYTKVL